MQIPPETQVVIDFDDNRAASALVGPYGQNLALVETSARRRRRFPLATTSPPSPAPATAATPGAARAGDAAVFAGRGGT